MLKNKNKILQKLKLNKMTINIINQAIHSFGH